MVLWAHDSACDQLVRASVEEYQPADVNRACIADRRDPTQPRTRLLKDGYHARSC